MTTATKTEKPILFSTELVQAILDGRKTQTRRVIKGLDSRVNCFHPYKDGRWEAGEDYFNGDGEAIDIIKCPYGKPGDELWVRETWKPVSYSDHGWIIKYKNGSTQEVERLFPLEENDKEIHWAEKTAEEFEQYDKIPWKPSIFMPREASRIQLTVEDIRVERVQDITESDARAEGIPNAAYAVNAVASFERLWNKINADRGYSWESNPWVWVVEFEVKEVRG